MQYCIIPEAHCEVATPSVVKVLAGRTMFRGYVEDPDMVLRKEAYGVWDRPREIDGVEEFVSGLGGTGWRGVRGPMHVVGCLQRNG